MVERGCTFCRLIFDGKISISLGYFEPLFTFCISILESISKVLYDYQKTCIYSLSADPTGWWDTLVVSKLESYSVTISQFHYLHFFLRFLKIQRQIQKKKKMILEKMDPVGDADHLILLVSP